MQQAIHDYSNDGGRRFFCKYKDKNFYLACHRYYSNDKFDKESTKVMFHNEPKFFGENFTFEQFKNGEFCLYYKDDADNMKNWILYIHKQPNMDYYTPLFHKTQCSKFVLDRVDLDYFYIRETNYNVYLYLNETKQRDDGSYYAGACSDIKRATKFKFIDV